MNIFRSPEQDPGWKELLGKYYKFKGKEDDPDPIIRILLIAGILSLGIFFYEHYALHQLPMNNNAM